MKRLLLALALLLCSGGAPHADEKPEKPAAEKKTPAPADAPSLKLPASLNGDPNDFIQIAADTNCNVVVWRVVDPGLKLFPTNLLRDTKTAVVTSGTPGRYRVWAVTALGGTPSDIAECVVVVGTPGPVPPGPGPGPGPTPTPIPGVGFKAMVIYETADLGKMPPKQLSIIEAKSIRDYLNAKTVPTADGGKRGWYITDQSADFSGESKVWQDAIKRPRTQIPWIILGDGKNGFEGPLPADVPATLELLRRFGG